MKFKTAPRAPHHDMALPLGDTDFLTAAGAFIDMKILVALVVFSQMRDVVPEIGKERSQLRGKLHPLLVFPVALCNIAGEHPEVHQRKTCEREPPQDTDRQEKLGHNQNKAGQR